MNWPRAILTDSGGFQVFSLSDLRKVTEEGVLFRSHLNGDQHLFTPESTVDVQLALGSDIMMVLDECLAYPASARSRARSMRTHRALGPGRLRALPNASPRRRARLFPDRPGLHVSPICAADCAEELLELDADGYAIGGLSVGEPRALSLEMTEITTPLLPRGPAALRHGRRDAGGAAGVRRARRRHDGLRTAVAQCP